MWFLRDPIKLIAERRVTKMGNSVCLLPLSLAKWTFTTAHLREISLYFCNLRNSQSIQCLESHSCEGYSYISISHFYIPYNT